MLCLLCWIKGLLGNQQTSNVFEIGLKAQIVSNPHCRVYFVVVHGTAPLQNYNNNPSQHVPSIINEHVHGWYMGMELCTYTGKAESHISGTAVLSSSV
jgi:hypothetical protein